MSSLQEDAEKFNQALREFVLVCAEETRLIKLMDIMKKKLKHKTNIGP